MKDILYSGLFSFIIVTLLLPLVIYFAKKFKVFVKPSFRKIHKGNISSMGGFAVFISVFLSIFIFTDLSRVLQNKFFFIAIIMAALLGMQDDLKDVKASYKLVVQTVIALILVFPESLHFHFGDDTISIVFSVLFYLLIINSFNFIDGVDLLASIIAALILLPLGGWFYLNDQYNFGLMMISLGGALLGFIIYNISPAKIFLGDMGTITIGLVLSVAFMKFINMNLQQESDFLIDIEYPVAAIFAIYNLPLIDLFRVVLLRLKRKRKPWIADRSHFHHILLKIGMKQNNIALLAAFYTVISFVLFYFLSKIINSSLILIGINIIGAAVFYLLIFLKKAKTNI